MEFNMSPRTAGGGRSLLIALALALPIAALVYVVMGGESVPPPHRIVIALDLSPSAAPGRCEDVERLVAALPSDADSEIILVGSGDATTGFEPTILARGELKANHSVLEGVERAGDERRAVIRELVTRCQAAPKRQVSPIFQTLASAVELFADAGCGRRVGCVAVLRTDGIENMEATVAGRLKRKSTAKAEPRIKNDGIDIVICGTSRRAVVGAGKLPDIAAVRRAFLPELSDPSRGSVAAECRPWNGGKEAWR